MRALVGPVRALPVVVAMLCFGCGGADPATGLAGSGTTTAFDLDLALDFILVVGDCEDAPGDPGEFSYRIRLEAPRQSHPLATAGFPDVDGATLMGDGESHPLDRTLSLASIPWEDRGSVALRFTALEYDGASPDPRMDLAETLDPVRFLATLQTVRVTVGDDPDCQLRLSATPEWTVSGR